MKKSMYRVFDWNIDGREDHFDTLKEAKAAYNKKVIEEPEGGWRLYKDTENPYRSGNFTEDCLAAHNQ